MTDLNEEITDVFAQLAAFNPSLTESIKILQSTQKTEGREYLKERAVEAVIDDCMTAMDMMPFRMVMENVRRLCKYPEGREAFKRALEKDPLGGKIVKAYLEAREGEQ